MTYSDAVHQYLDLCKVSGKAESTLDSYARTLRFFGSFLMEHHVESIQCITPALLTSWKEETAQSVSPSSLRLYITHVKGFLDFCTDIEYLSKNPFKKKLMEVAVKDSDQKNTTSHILSVQQFRLVFTNDDPRGTHRQAIARNRAILALMITSGIRCKSLCSLRMADMDVLSRSISVQNAKGGKNGEILYSTIAINAVSDYIQSGYLPDLWYQDNQRNTLFGFVDGNGIWTPYCREQMSAIVEAAVRGFTGESGFRAHSMRHTCASLLSAGGMSDGEISRMLMHTDGSGAQVTNRYIERDNRELFEKANAIFNQILK